MRKKSKAKVLGDYVDNDIGLCRTTNQYAGNEAVDGKNSFY